MTNRLRWCASLVVPFAIALLGTTPCAEAQRLRGGGLSGTIVSGQAEGAAPLQSMLLAAPAQGFLVVTQVCAEQGSADRPTQVVAGTFGALGESGGCVTFEPGIALPQGDDVSCANTGLQAGARLPRCLVTGVVTNK